MEEHSGHEDLRGSGRQSVVPYVHRRVCCIAVCVRCSSHELKLSESNAYPAFYSSRLRQLQGLSKTRHVVSERLGHTR
jgi:hypothetical protein